MPRTKSSKNQKSRSYAHDIRRKEKRTKKPRIGEKIEQIKDQTDDTWDKLWDW